MYVGSGVTRDSGAPYIVTPLYVGVLHVTLIVRATARTQAVFENTYFTFFSQLKKHDFLRFFNNLSKNVKSR